MPTILVVDDDKNIREVVQFALEREGFAVELCADGEAGLRRAQRGGIDLVVLDILMPELDGIEVCRRLRQTTDLPVVFLSSKGDEIDRIVGLELGADDYLAKPFSPRELVARVRAVLRRGSARRADAEDDAPRPLEVGPVRLDPARHEVSCGGEAILLTVTEFTVLQSLLTRPGQVMTRQVLVEKVYSLDHHITDRTIDTHVRRIRAKFKKCGYDPIETVHGLGYKARSSE
ncbi:MAG: response regulator transcription factor [Myxococcales bacterium]|nr:response regulator transcription factor [Myxococcales bacterium]